MPMDDDALLKALQQLLYLQPLLEREHLPDTELRKKLEEALNYNHCAKCLIVKEGCCEMLIFCPTKETKMCFMQKETIRSLEAVITEISADMGWSNVNFEVEIINTKDLDESNGITF